MVEYTREESRAEFGPASAVVGRFVLAYRRLHSSRFVKNAAGVLAVSLLGAMRPLRRVRIAPVRPDSLGGFVAQVDLAISLLDLEWGGNTPGTVNVFFIGSPAANPVLASKYCELLRRRDDCRVWESNSNPLFKLGELLARGLESLALDWRPLRDWYCGSPTWEGLDAKGFAEDGRPRITLDAGECMKARSDLQLLGIGDDASIFCFGLRDSAYWGGDARTESQKGIGQGGGRTQDFRNSDPLTYVPAINWLLEEGYTVVRMGAQVASPFPLEHERFIDYAVSNLRTPLNDLYLFRECHAALFGNSFGLAELANLFHKPLCVVNYRPFNFTHWSNPNVLIVPSLLRDRSSGELLPLRKMTQHTAMFGWYFESQNLEFLDNEAEDILSATQELVRRLRETPVDGGTRAEELNARFWSVEAETRTNRALYIRADGSGRWISNRYGPREFGTRPLTPRVSAAFLERYSAVLLG